MFAAQDLCHYQFTCTSGRQFRSNISQMQQSKLLQQTFFTTDYGSPFVASGFRPVKLIAANVWVRQFYLTDNIKTYSYENNKLYRAMRSI